MILSITRNNQALPSESRCHCATTSAGLLLWLNLATNALEEISCRNEEWTELSQSLHSHNTTALSYLLLPSRAWHSLFLEIGGWAWGTMHKAWGWHGPSAIFVCNAWPGSVTVPGRWNSAHMQGTSLGTGTTDVHHPGATNLHHYPCTVACLWAWVELWWHMHVSMAWGEWGNPMRRPGWNMAQCK